MNESEIFKKLFEVIEKYKLEKSEKLVDFKEQEELKQILNLDWGDASQNWDDVFHWVDQYLKYSVHTDNSQFFNRMWAGATIPSQIWEIITTITNTCSSTYESAPVSTIMEKYMITTFLDLVGFHNWEWQMTTGSSNANMIAMMIARNEKWDNILKSWLQYKRKLVAFVNEEAHYSMDKAANIIWIWTDNLIKIPTLANWEMDTIILEKEILKVVNTWNIPFFVSATAWTTVRWAYDNIEEIVRLKEKYNFWLHVDGAWWWVVFLNDNLRDKFLKWIDKVDSFTFDFHKMPWLSLMCNMFLLNNNQWKWFLWNNCCLGDTNYIFSEEKDNSNFTYNLWEHSLQCWKKVDSLKLFLDWKYNWKQWISDKIQHYYDLCNYAEEIIINSTSLEFVVNRVSFNLCFRYKVPKNLNSNDINLNIKTLINKSWYYMVWWAYIDDVYIIRLLICNDNTDKKNIDSFFEKIIQLWDSLI